QRAARSPYTPLFRSGEEARSPCGPEAVAMTDRVDLSEFGAEKQDLRGVVNPREHHQKRPRCSIRRSETAAAEIQADPDLTYGEQRRRYSGTEPHVAPRDIYIR